VSETGAVELLTAEADLQPPDVRGLAPDERDALIVSAVKVDGECRVLSRYGADRWELVGATTNVCNSGRVLNFKLAPEPLRATMKAVVYRYLRRGRAGQKRPRAASVRLVFAYALPFLHHLVRNNVRRLADVTPEICKLYVDACKAERTKEGAKPLVASTLSGRFRAVEAIHELSQYTDNPMTSLPWPGMSAYTLAGLNGTDPGPGKGKRRSCKTPLIPNAAFAGLYQAAWQQIENGERLLAVRDQLDAIEKKVQGYRVTSISRIKRRHLAAIGWAGKLERFEESLFDLRTACYIVVASLSGCRNHELAYVQTDACYCTEDDDGEIYWWMRARSTKTDEGHTEWMIPEAAVTALRIMDRWAKPYQVMIEAEIASRRAADPSDPQITEARRHVAAVFLGIDTTSGNRVRTLSIGSWNHHLRDFAHRHGIDWHLTTHQFRRKFSNYAARSQYGDLRYLKEHFKHWSMDMTLAYALNESQEAALYSEIQDELDLVKDELVEQWLQADEPLAGGYGRGLVAWRGSDEVTIFKDRRTMIRAIADSTAIRSNGHAWCTADDNLCVGNGGLERVRCTDCSNAVIGRVHADIYQGMYDHLQEVLTCNDIGSGGYARVRRDLDRCRDVLQTLGYAPQERVT
jgi:integrase